MTDTTASSPAADTEATRVQGIADQLAAMKTEILGAVKDMLTHQSPAGQTATQAPQSTGQPADLQAQIDAAVAKVTQDRDAHDAAARHDAEHDAIRAAQAEKPPTERKRVHRFMGWGEPAQ